VSENTKTRSELRPRARTRGSARPDGRIFVFDVTGGAGVEVHDRPRAPSLTMTWVAAGAR
jgi:hypothetical protein